MSNPFQVFGQKQLNNPGQQTVMLSRIFFKPEARFAVPYLPKTIFPVNKLLSD